MAFWSFSACCWTCNNDYMRRAWAMRAVRRSTAGIPSITKSPTMLWPRLSAPSGPPLVKISVGSSISQMMALCQIVFHIEPEYTCLKPRPGLLARCGDDGLEIDNRIVCLAIPMGQGAVMPAGTGTQATARQHIGRLTHADPLTLSNLILRSRLIVKPRHHGSSRPRSRPPPGGERRLFEAARRWPGRVRAEQARHARSHGRP